MKIYISGAITGLPVEEMRQKFAKAEYFIGEAGHEAVNPLKLPHTNLESWFRCMAIDIDALRHCDAIYLCEDWKQSKGAQLEYELAILWGLKVYTDLAQLVNKAA